MYCHLAFCLLISCAVGLSAGSSEEFESSGFDNLDEYLQPDDVDNGDYDQIFYRESDEVSENGVVTNNDVVSAKAASGPGLVVDSLCARPCDGTTRTCYYKFKIEHYTSMGISCGNCTCSSSSCTRVKDCDNPHCITANGVKRNMITVNKRYPGTPIYVCKGDRVVVDVTNMLQGKITTLHWHGMFQKGRPWMDGVNMVSQCPIIPGTSFRYDFIAAEAGTHFWHDHAGFIKLDGVQGPLVVREPKNIATRNTYYKYDCPSHTMFLTDWKNFMSDDEFPQLKQLPNNRRIQALLINGKGAFEGVNNYYGSGTWPYLTSPLATFDVRADYTYRFRIIGAFCMMCPIELSIEDHEMTVIAVDGNPVQTIGVKSLVITSGERYDIVISAFRPIRTYWIWLRGVSPCQDTRQVALLRYNNASRPSRFTSMPITLGSSLNHPNMSLTRPNNHKISELMSYEPTPLKIAAPKSTTKYRFVVSSHAYTLDEFYNTNNSVYFNLPAGGPIRSTINGISSTMSSSPLFTQFADVPNEQFCSASCVNGTSETVCQPCVHLVKIPYNQTVDFIISDAYNYTGIVHPFHLHGHKFHVLEQGMMNETVTVDSLMQRLEEGDINIIRPAIKDTIMVPQGAYAIIRFFTDNPGIWIFHCHYAYHNAVGMHVFLQVGETNNFPIAPHNFPQCKSYLPQI